MMSLYEHKWKQSINNVKGKSGKGRNTLRRYCTYKQIFYVEKYCLLIMPPKHRSALSKFRCGVAPIRIETGRYENLKENERVCPYVFVIVLRMKFMFCYIVICMLMLDNPFLIKLCPSILHFLLLTMMISCLLFFPTCQ